VLRISAAVVSAAAGAYALGRVAWRRTTGCSVSLLHDAARRRHREADATPVVVPPDVPEPVARYFAFALPAGSERISTAHVRWTGELQMQPGSGWLPFEAEQHFTDRPPGFVWDARIRMLPLISVRVRDGYVAGVGTMLARVGGLVTVVEAGGTPEMAASALARWLGEAVWFPSALLPGANPAVGVRWAAVDARTARATVTDGRTAVSADFHFAPTGEITGMTTMRYREVNGTAVLTPFEGRYRDYARHHGVMVPTSAEVAWLLPEGRFPYWRGRLAALDFHRGAPPGTAEAP
jgi:hypothetical protein